MITEDYVSLKIAKLLKEKGFDGEWHKHYWGYESGKEFLTSDSYNSEYDYPAPTLQITMKWLRKIHRLHIMVDCIGSENYIPTIQFTHNSKDIMLKGEKGKIGGNGFDSYEEATEAAIKYCLENLI